MRNIIIFLTLLIGFSFAAPTAFGGVAIKDIKFISSTADLVAETIVTSRNSSGGVVSTVNVFQLPTAFSVYNLDSSVNTLNMQLVTDNRRVDGQIIIINCVGYSKPISITTNVLVSAPATPNGAPYLSDTVLDTSTANLVIDSLGDSITFQYLQSKGKYVIISNDL